VYSPHGDGSLDRTRGELKRFSSLGQNQPRRAEWARSIQALPQDRENGSSMSVQAEAGGRIIKGPVIAGTEHLLRQTGQGFGDAFTKGGGEPGRLLSLRREQEAKGPAAIENEAAIEPGQSKITNQFLRLG
jgi:hypothetical protein